MFAGIVNVNPRADGGRPTRIDRHKTTTITNGNPRIVFLISKNSFRVGVLGEHSSTQSRRFAASRGLSALPAGSKPGSTFRGNENNRPCASALRPASPSDLSFPAGPG